MPSRKLRPHLSVVLLMGVLSGIGKAQATVHVPQDQPTIQAGIDAANAGDTVLVSPGTYNELIDFKGKAITVTSGATGVAGATQTIINGGSADGPVVTFANKEGTGAVLNGFTVQNGQSLSRTATTGGGGRLTHNYEQRHLEECRLRDSGRRRCEPADPGQHDQPQSRPFSESSTVRLPAGRWIRRNGNRSGPDDFFKDHWKHDHR